MGMILEMYVAGFSDSQICIELDVSKYLIHQTIINHFIFKEMSNNTQVIRIYSTI